MSEAQGAGAPQAPAQQTQAQSNTTPAKQQGAGQTGTVGDQTGTAVSEAAKEAARKLKLKYDDGTEEEIDEAEALRVYRERKKHQAVASRELNEGREAKKQAEKFLSMMKDKKTLFETIKKLGHDPRPLAEEFLAEQLKREMMDPRERELMETKAELQRLKELDEAQKRAVEERNIQMLKEKFSKEYNEQFISALKASSLPPTKETVAEMAKYIARSAKIGFKMTADEAAKLVKEDIEERQKRLYGEADAETLVRLLGDQGLQKLRAYDTGRLKNPEANLVTPQNQEAQPRKRSSTGRMSPKEWREFNRR